LSGLPLTCLLPFIMSEEARLCWFMLHVLMLWTWPEATEAAFASLRRRANFRPKI
jgi:hypothetical protein